MLPMLPAGRFPGDGGVGQMLSPSAVLGKLETVALEGPYSAPSEHLQRAQFEERAVLLHGFTCSQMRCVEKSIHFVLNRHK